VDVFTGIHRVLILKNGPKIRYFCRIFNKIVATSTKIPFWRLPDGVLAVFSRAFHAEIDRGITTGSYEF